MENPDSGDYIEIRIRLDGALRKILAGIFIVCLLADAAVKVWGLVKH